MTNESNWLIPFKGHNHSGAYDVNFLYREGNVYISDNHRVALWSWFQHIDTSRQYSLFHVDRHTDALQSQMDSWLDALPNNLHMKSLEDYLSYQYQGNTCRVPVMRWDNYISIMLRMYPTLINNARFVTHEEGDKPNFNGQALITHSWWLPDNVEYWMNSGEWIVNIDLDYFFCDDGEGQIRMFSDQFIQTVFNKFSAKIQDGSIKVLTISLSPDFSGGWVESTKLCNKISEWMGLSFSLPQTNE